MEPIAIVGMACRFPGAPSLDAFWTLLREGRDAIVPVPAERWDADAMYAADPKAPGRTNTRHGGFIGDFDRFDAAYFGISPREAVQMDPQQRILLELAVEAFEDAGIGAGALAGSDTAVYVGVMSNDYARWQTADNYRRIDVHTGGGAGFCMLANRLSYQFDLHGPSLAIDSACSSSLVTVYQACQALWTGQSALALAGGVNLMLDPAFNVFYAKGGLMAADARCKTFSADADGIGRGEGAGLVVLKRESDALRDGDAIYARIRGGAVNHGGRSNGVTAPNRWAQEALLRRALQHAGVHGSDLRYVELHGTGTAIGDPIEANALGTVLNEEGAVARCRVGSVKSNIGHLEGAAGIAGLIKLALSLHHQMLPPSLWFDRPNPAIDFDGLPLEVNNTARPWPAQAHAPRIGGINSFGLGGTNVHLVLESAPEAAAPAPSPADLPAHLVLLSARSEAALREHASRMQDALDSDVDVAAVMMTSLRRRGVHDWRLLVVGRDRVELRAGLGAFVAGQPHEAAHVGRVKARRHAVRLALAHVQAFVPARLAECLRLAPHALDAWQRCRELLMEQGDTRLPAPAALACATWPTDASSQALWCFAGQYALAAQLVAALRTPPVLVADGSGQLVAACIAGALTLSRALAWLRAGLEPLQRPATGTYAMRCDCGGHIDPALETLDWRSDPAAWTQRWQLREGGVDEVPIVFVSPAEPVDPPVDALACVSADGLGFALLFARLGARCALNFSTLADQRFVRLPSYPWQRESYLLPRPMAAGGGNATAAAAADALSSVAARVAPRGAAVPAEDESLRDELIGLAAAARAARLDRYLRERIGAALHVSADRIDSNAPLNTLGIDSLTAVEIKGRIERDLRVKIPVVRFLGNDAVNDFVTFIVTELDAVSGGGAPAAGPVRATTAQVHASATTAGPTPVRAQPRAAADIDTRIAAMSAHQIDDLLAQLVGAA